MLHQHGGGDTSHAAGDGSDGVHNGLDLVKLCVACNAAEAAVGVGLVCVSVDGHINDDLSGPDKIGGQGVQNARCGNDDVRPPADFGGVHGPGVADGDGGILALAVNAVVVKDLHAGGGRAGCILYL